MASAARVASLNSANAKPRGRPVTRSLPSRTRTAGSIWASTGWSSSSVVSKDRLPTKIVDEMGGLLLESIRTNGSSLRSHRRPLEEGTAGHQGGSRLLLQDRLPNRRGGSATGTGVGPRAAAPHPPGGPPGAAGRPAP